MSVLIEARNLRKSYRQVLAVDGASFQVAAGEVYGLIGPDGAGKTTTMRLLCGALRPDNPSDKKAGHTPTSIQIAGYDMANQPEAARARIGYLSQRFALYEELSVLENIRFFAEQRGLRQVDWQSRCMEILGFVGLADFIHRRAGHLSGGMRQKLGLAAALVHQPQVLLLDEPTTGVDPVTRQDFWQLIIRLVGQSSATNKDTAVLVSTPYMDEAARCSRIGFLHHGRLALEGTPTELCQRLQDRVIELQGEPLTTLRRLVQSDPDIQDVQRFGDRLHIRVNPGKAQIIIERLTGQLSGEDVHVQRIRPVPPQLEDVFIDMLANQA